MNDLDSLKLAYKRKTETEFWLKKVLPLEIVIAIEYKPDPNIKCSNTKIYVKDLKRFDTSNPHRSMIIGKVEPIQSLSLEYLKYST